MSDIRGKLKVTADGEEYTLFFGMSAIADLQAKHGQDVLSKVEPPEGASKDWIPPFQIMIDLFLASLERYHADVADKWLVDDIVSQNDGAFNKLMGNAMPDAKPASGNVKSRKTAAA